MKASTYSMMSKTTTAAMMAYRIGPPMSLPPLLVLLLAEFDVGGFTVGAEVTGGNDGAIVGGIDANVGKEVGEVVGANVGELVPQLVIRVNGPVVVPNPSTAT